MQSTPEFGMELIEAEPKFPVPCNSSECGTPIQEISKTSRPYFKDSLASKTYCELCGNRLRYHRKKASQRGEEMPRTFQDVQERHAEHARNP